MGFINGFEEISMQTGNIIRYADDKVLITDTQEAVRDSDSHERQE